MKRIIFGLVFVTALSVVQNADAMLTVRLEGGGGGPVTVADNGAGDTNPLTNTIDVDLAALLTGPHTGVTTMTARIVSNLTVGFGAKQTAHLSITITHETTANTPTNYTVRASNEYTGFTRGRLRDFRGVTTSFNTPQAALLSESATGDQTGDIFDPTTYDAQANATFNIVDSPLALPDNARLYGDLTVQTSILPSTTNSIQTLTSSVSNPEPLSMGLTGLGLGLLGVGYRRRRSKKQKQQD